MDDTGVPGGRERAGCSVWCDWLKGARTERARRTCLFSLFSLAKKRMLSILQKLLRRNTTWYLNSNHN